MTRFDDYLAELIASCEGDPRITGLVLMGSTADRARVDEWSDHDVAVIADAADVEPLRRDLSWLPRHDGIALWAREHHDGFKVVYDDGAVVEFGVTDLDGLAGWHANDWSVAYGGPALTEAMRAVAAKPLPGFAGDPAVLLAALLIGVGRARRGESLSAASSVRGLALDHLLLLLRTSVADTLDPRRRFELAHPALGAELVAAQELPVEECARTMLHIAERELDLDARAVAAVRGRLGWH